MKYKIPIFQLFIIRAFPFFNLSPFSYFTLPIFQLLVPIFQH